MPLPRVELYLNTSQLPTVQCPGNHPRSPRNVKAVFPPAFCWALANNQDPAAGWAYITREEASMLTILRQHSWFKEAMDELRARDLEAQMESVSIEESTVEGEAKEE